MKFDFSEEWCENAAKLEMEVGGVGGLMACNPKYLPTNISNEYVYMTDECHVELVWSPTWYKPWTWLYWRKLYCIDKSHLVSLTFIEKE